MNREHTHTRHVALHERLQLLRVRWQQQKADALFLAATLDAALEVLDAQELELHESMRDLDDERLTR